MNKMFDEVDVVVHTERGNAYEVCFNRETEEVDGKPYDYANTVCIKVADMYDPIEYVNAITRAEVLDAIQEWMKNNPPVKKELAK